MLEKLENTALGIVSNFSLELTRKIFFDNSILRQYLQLFKIICFSSGTGKQGNRETGK